MSESERSYIGCGDSLCEFGRPPGMNTNGGCQCFKIHGLDPDQAAKVRRIKQFVRAQRERIKELEAHR